MNTQLRNIQVGVIGAALFAAYPALATTAISGDVSAGARSTLGAVIVTDSHTSHIAAPNSGGVSTLAGVIASDAGATNQAFAAAGGHWNSADSGHVTMYWGWNVDAPGYAGAVIAETNLAYPISWQYTFTASGNGTFSGDYNVVGSGDKFGLQQLYGTNDFTNAFAGGVSDPTGFGTFSIALISGQTYTMSLAEYGNISNGFGGIVAHGSADALVNWQITYDAAVPEPASWALMIAGFGLVGATLRRRRSVAATA